MLREVDFKISSLRNLVIDVLCGETIILKGVVDPRIIKTAVLACHEWSKMTPETIEHPAITGGASHYKSFLPARSESRYILHDYYFSPTLGNVNVLPEVIPVFDALLVIYNELLNENREYDTNFNGYMLMPQVIQYPRGGGFFSEHFHPIHPQKVGLVLAGSEYGKDYRKGGGRFRGNDGSWVSTEGRHQIGDVSLFRFDIGHDITPVDPDYQLDWNRPDGRWTFVLPLKPTISL